MKNICIFAEILNWSFYGVRDGENPEGRWWLQVWLWLRLCLLLGEGNRVVFEFFEEWNKRAHFLIDKVLYQR